MGLHYQGRGDLDKAEEEYRRTLELDPNYGAGFNQLGIVYKLRKQYERPWSFFRNMLYYLPATRTLWIPWP